MTQIDDVNVPAAEFPDRIPSMITSQVCGQIEEIGTRRMLCLANPTSISAVTVLTEEGETLQVNTYRCGDHSISGETVAERVDRLSPEVAAPAPVKDTSVLMPTETSESAQGTLFDTPPTSET